MMMTMMMMAHDMVSAKEVPFGVSMTKNNV